MPAAADQLDKRLEVITAYIRRRRVSNQGQIVGHLMERGFEVTQASVSRDLARLRARKVAGRYRLPAPEGAGPENPLDAILAALILDVREAGPNLVVVVTPPGGASPLGVHLDAQGWPEMVGTVAGDDTLFAAVRSRMDQKLIVRRLRDAANRKGLE